MYYADWLITQSFTTLRRRNDVSYQHQFQSFGINLWIREGIFTMIADIILGLAILTFVLPLFVFFGILMWTIVRYAWEDLNGR